MVDTLVQIERMRPEELRHACETFPVAYIPVGATEYHGYHLPVGLDSLKAHGILCRVAKHIGGVVVPPIFHGTGGGHQEFEWTWMVSPEVLRQMLLETCHGLQRSGIELIVIMCGHYPNSDVAQEVVQLFSQEENKTKILSLAEHEAYPESGEFHGDHASKWETSLMLALGEEMVDLNRLQISPFGKSADQFPDHQTKTPEGWWFEKNKEHPWYAVAASRDNKPTEASKDIGQKAVDHIVSWISTIVLKTLHKQP